MMNNSAYVESLISEYSGMVNKNMLKETSGDIAHRIIARKLVKSADWSPAGADEILKLVNQYGAFMLRNALALAVALGKEDGEREF